MMKEFDRSCPCYNEGKGCNKRHVTSTYNCHSYCSEYKEWADTLASENELVRQRKAAEADVNSVRIKSIKKTQKEREIQKCRWGG
jgi:hypothetical protein